jgi:tetraacyldisaccharide 4'-kinase
MSARRPWAWPLVPLYATVLRLQDALRSEPKKLAWPVVSVGSVSAGGAGKTPVVIALAKMLGERGWRVDVLSRGYGREGMGIARVDPDGDDAARVFGDEPVLMARETGVPVWVGSNRYTAGGTAENAVAGSGDQQILCHAQNASAKRDSVHLLDDGFQHRQLKRDLDIVLITADDLDDALLPAGNRREPLEALLRADVVVIREQERETVEARVSKLMHTGALLWSVHRRLRFPAPLGVLSAGLRPLAFCAIARPDDFASALHEAGCGVIDAVIFNDHAPYTEREMKDLIAIAKKLDVSGFVTTEKDAVKLSAELRAQLEAVGPLMVVALEAEFVYPERVARELEARLA